MSPSKPRFMRRPTVSFNLERAADMCCCYFLTAGLLLAIYKLLPPQPAFPWAFALCPLAALLIITLFGRRFLLVLGALAAIFLLFNYAHLTQWWNTARAFFNWWQAGFNPDNEAFFYYYYLLTHVLLALAMTLCVWLLIRLRPPFVLLAAACLATLIAVAASGIGGHSTSIYLLAAGLIPLAAASSVAREPVARGRAAVLALPLTALLLATVFFSLPADTAIWRWQPLSDKVEELRQSARAQYQSWLQRDETLPSFDLTEQYHTRLGGPIQPDNTRMLQVKTTAPLLLKGSVYDYYTGHGWEKSRFYHVPTSLQPYYDINAPSEKAVPFLPGPYDQQLTRALGYLPSAGSNHPLGSFTRQVNATVTLLHPQEPRLFYYGRLTEFSSADDIVAMVEENSELKAGQQLLNGYSYGYTSLVLDRTHRGFSEAMAALTEQLSQEELALNSVPIAELANYRQLPAALSLFALNDYTATRQMVLEIANAGLAPGETRSPYEQAVVVERWLKENFRYTLTPDTPPEDEDFMLHFLQTREGYCTYYATTMVIMSRLLGISARYVTGYALKPARGLNQYEATNATAHAWAELYFPGAGWLTFDPTGQADYTEASASTSTGQAERDVFGPAEAARPVGAGPPLDYRRPLAAPLALAALILLLPILLLKRARRAYRLPQLLKRLEHGDILEVYYHDLLGQLNQLGWQRRPAETIIGFTRRLGSYLPRQAGQLLLLGRSVSALRYGGLTPNASKLELAAALHEHFETLLRQQLKRGEYYFYRLRHSPKRNWRIIRQSLPGGAKMRPPGDKEIF